MCVSERERYGTGTYPTEAEQPSDSDRRTAPASIPPAQQKATAETRASHESTPHDITMESNVESSEICPCTPTRTARADVINLLHQSPTGWRNRRNLQLLCTLDCKARQKRLSRTENRALRAASGSVHQTALQQTRARVSIAFHPQTGGQANMGAPVQIPAQPIADRLRRQLQ